MILSIKQSTNVIFSGLLFSLLLALLGSPLLAKPMAPESIMGVTTISAKDLVNKVIANPELVVIDSRHHEEYLKGHIESAINILNTDMTEEILSKYVSDLSTPVVFYCNGERCLRSSNAASKALSWGYTNIYWFRTGWLDWIKNQYPIER